MGDNKQFSDSMTDSILKNTEGSTPPTPSASTTTSSTMVDSIMKNTATQPLSGKFADYALSSGPAGAILNYFGQGIVNNWGQTKKPGEPPPNPNDPNNQKQGILKSINEAFIRPLATSFSDVWEKGSVPASKAALDILREDIKPHASDEIGIGPGFNEDIQTLKTAWDASNYLLSPIFGAAHQAGVQAVPKQYPDLAEAVGQGMEGALMPLLGHKTPELPNIAALRAGGKIGEGDQGAYNTVPVSPENMEVRAEAAKKAGIPVPPVEPVVKDVHVLARQISPIVMQEYDAKVALHQELTERLNSLQLPDFITKGQPDFLRPKSPELQATEEAFKDNYNSLQELQPYVDQAYDHASSLIPPVESSSTAETPTNQAKPVTPEALTAPIEEESRVRDAQKPAEGEESVPGTGQPTQEEAVHGAPSGSGELQFEPQIDLPEGSLGGNPKDVLPESKLVIARKLPDGTVVKAGEGKLHSDLLSPEEYSKLLNEESEHEAPLHHDEEMGYVDDKGKFYSRKEAMDFIQNENKTLRGGRLESIQGTGETRIMGLAKSIEDAAKEHGFEGEDFNDLPTHQSIVIKDQAEGWARLLNDDPGLVKDVVLGKQPAPEGLSPMYALVALEKDATARGDWSTIRELASSQQVKAATTSGQNLRILAERDPYSPTSAMKAVQDSWTNRLSNSLKMTKASKAITDSIQKFTDTYKLTGDDIHTFLKSIECDY